MHGREAEPSSAIVDARPRGWFWLDNAFLDAYQAELGPIAVSLYCRLVRLAGERGDCYPSVPRLCEWVGIGETALRKHLKRLIEAGLVTVSQRLSEEGDPTSNLYTIARVPDFHGVRVANPPTSVEGVRVANQVVRDDGPPLARAANHPPYKKTYSEGGTPSPARPREDAAPKSEEPDYRLAAERLRSRTEAATVRYLRTLPAGKNAARLLEVFEFHLRAGHPLTVAAFEWAVDECIRSWQENAVRGSPRSIEPVLAKLAERINPLPKLAPGEKVAAAVAQVNHRRRGSEDEATIEERQAATLAAWEREYGGQ